MLDIEFTSKMKHDVKRIKKRGKDLLKLHAALQILASQELVPQGYKDHQLKGEMHEYRECHIEPDWLLIYRIFEEKLILSAFGTGTHADLFDE
jgi:mRNA interferase YafQ